MMGAWWDFQMTDGQQGDSGLFGKFWNRNTTEDCYGNLFCLRKKSLPSQFRQHRENHSYVQLSSSAATNHESNTGSTGRTKWQELCSASRVFLYKSSLIIRSLNPSNKIPRSLGQFQFTSQKRISLICAAIPVQLVFRRVAF